jgi:signal transduction histidine kinase
MKLLTKTNLYYSLFAILIFIIGGFAFYYIIQNKIYEEIDEALISRKGMIIKQLNVKGDAYLNELVPGEESGIIKTDDKSKAAFWFHDTLIFNPGQKEGEPFRCLTFLTTVNNTFYKINIRRSATDSESLIEGIVTSTSVIFLLLLGGGAVLNYFISKKFWKPFYNVLEIIKDYRPTAKSDIKLPQSSISEFKELNKVIERFITKVENDFINLKQFSENASHEIQTPLAVIKTKSEMLLQREELDEEVFKEIASINEAATRLSKLNKALLQLMKIENRQYQESELIDLSRLLEIKLQRLNELIGMKNITIKTSIDKNVSINMNVSLADIMLSNILNNSIKHNIIGGEIIVCLIPNKLSIKNTGKILHTAPGKLFDRFVKESTSNDSLGLGLSLVRQICETYNFSVSYNYANCLHEIKIDF